MTLFSHRLRKDVKVNASTSSIGTTPVAGVAVAPTAGYIQRVFAAAGGTTTGTVTVSVSINGGSDITNSLLTIAPGSGARNNPPLEFAYTAAPNLVAEGDLITFTPSSGTGASITGAFGCVIRTGTAGG